MAGVLMISTYSAGKFNVERQQQQFFHFDSTVNDNGTGNGDAVGNIAASAPTPTMPIHSS
jgi:hypothetical protein